MLYRKKALKGSTRQLYLIANKVDTNIMELPGLNNQGFFNSPSLVIDLFIYSKPIGASKSTANYHCDRVFAILSSLNVSKAYHCPN